MPFIVTASMGSNRRKVKSRKFSSRAEAESFARATARDRPGSNPRVSRV